VRHIFLACFPDFWWDDRSVEKELYDKDIKDIMNGFLDNDEERGDWFDICSNQFHKELL
jgi:hypothetical protein